MSGRVTSTWAKTCNLPIHTLTGSCFGNAGIGASMWRLNHQSLNDLLFFLYSEYVSSAFKDFKIKEKIIFWVYFKWKTCQLHLHYMWRQSHADIAYFTLDSWWYCLTCTAFKITELQLDRSVVFWCSFAQYSNYKGNILFFFLKICARGSSW